MLAVATSSGPANQRLRSVQVFTCLCCQTHKCWQTRCHRHHSCPMLMEGTTFPRTPNSPYLVFGGLQLSLVPPVVPADVFHFVLSAPVVRHKAVVLLDSGGNRKRYTTGITIRFLVPPCRAVLPPAGTRSAPPPIGGRNGSRIPTPSLSPSALLRCHRLSSRAFTSHSRVAWAMNLMTEANAALSRSESSSCH